MQLIVLGMHRSGTSVLARLLNMMGAYFGPEGMSTGANPENPKGFWERRDVRKLNDALLHSIACDWNRLASFAIERIPATVVEEFDEQASTLILEMDGHRPWLMKEPRLCLLLALWRRLFDVPILIHIVRHPVEVAASLHRRNAIPVHAGLALWEKYVRCAFAMSSDLPAIIVPHAALMASPAAMLEKLHRDLVQHGVSGIRMPSVQEINSFVDPALHHGTRAQEDLLKYADAPQVALFDQIISGRPSSEWPSEQPQVLQATLARYEATLGPHPAPDSFGNFVLPLSRMEAAERRAEETTRRNAAEARAGIDGVRSNLAELKAVLATAPAHPARAPAALQAQPHGEVDDRDAQSLAASPLQGGVNHAAEIFRLTRLAMATEATLQRRFEQAQREQIEAETQGAEASARATQLLGELKRRQEDLEHSGLALKGVNDRLAAAERIAQQSAAELQRARERLRQQQCAQNAADASSRRSSLALQAQVIQLRGLLRSQQAQLDATRLSLSWKVMAPLRWLQQVLTGKRRNADNQEGEIAAIRRSGLLDGDWYRTRYPDVAGSGMDPVSHYFKHGAAEGRDPSPHFSTERYMADHPELLLTAQNPLLHELEHRRIMQALVARDAGAPE